MQDLISVLQREVHAVVEAFYTALSELPKSQQILHILSPEEFAYLKKRQAENLLALAVPDLSADDHARMAQRVGRVHAIVGLDKEELARSRDALAKALDKVIGGQVSPQAISAYTRRLNTDLAWQLKAYQALQDSQQRVLLKVTEAVWDVHQYTDFIQTVVREVSLHDEITRVGICRPDSQGVFHFEAVAPQGMGQVLNEMALSPATQFLTDAGDPRGQSHIGLAWRSGTVQRVVNVRVSPQLDIWRTALLDQGVRSSVAIPLGRQDSQSPLAILVIDCAYPGGFSGPHQVAFIDLLDRLLDGAFMRLTDLDARGAVSYASRIHWATLLRSGGLKMYYQPLLDLRTGRVAKVEALARLIDSDRVCSPGEFLPAFSSDDYFELYVRGLEQALAQRQQWMSGHGLTLALSMNLPPAALNDVRYYEATCQALNAHGCPPEALTLEVLENEELSLAEGRYVILNRFKALGVQLAQDDLGAGHSGLSSLRRVPFDWVKLDRGMLQMDQQAPSGSLAFLLHLTSLAHAMGRLVVAEGVESWDLLFALQALGVDVVQGYAISMPMPPESLPSWMASHVDMSSEVRKRGEGALCALARFLRWEEGLRVSLGNVSLLQALRGLLGGQAADPGAVKDDDALVLALLEAGEQGAEPPSARQAKARLVRALLGDGQDSAGYLAARAEVLRILSRTC